MKANKILSQLCESYISEQFVIELIFILQLEPINGFILLSDQVVSTCYPTVRSSGLQCYPVSLLPISTFSVSKETHYLNLITEIFFSDQREPVSLI